LYLATGFSIAEGYEGASWNQVQSELKIWCDGNNQRHSQTGWVLLTHGALDHSIGSYVANRGGHVVFLHTDQAWMPLISKQWPQHTSAGCFVPHTPALEQGRVDEELLNAQFAGENLKITWGVRSQRVARVRCWSRPKCSNSLKGATTCMCQPRTRQEMNPL